MLTFLLKQVIIVIKLKYIERRLIVMSLEKLKNVLDKISQDTNLLKKFSEKVFVETVNLLKQNGYSETEEQMQQDILKLLNINEEKLELVSGGSVNSSNSSWS